MKPLDFDVNPSHVMLGLRLGVGLGYIYVGVPPYSAWE